MLTKLVKHELKSSYRNYLPVFAAVIIGTILMWVQRYAETIDAFIMVLALTMMLIMVLFILVFVNIFKSLGERIFGKPGYLLFTVPAKTSQIILSRIIANFIWIIAATLIAYLPIFVMMDVIVEMFGDMSESFNVVDLLLSLLGVDVNAGALDITLSIVNRIFDFTVLLAVTLFANAFVSTLYKGDRKKLIVFLSYIALYIVYSTISSTSIFQTTGTATNALGETYEYYYHTTLQSGLLAIFKLAASVGLFAYSNVLIDTKLELE